MLQELCGGSTFRNVAIVTSGRWEENHYRYADREAELMEDIHFRLVINKGAQLARYDNTIASAQKIIRLILDNHSLSRTRSSDQNATVYHSVDNFSGGGEAYTLSVGSRHPRSSHHVCFPLGSHSSASVTYIPWP